MVDVAEPAGPERAADYSRMGSKKVSSKYSRITNAYSNSCMDNEEKIPLTVAVAIQVLKNWYKDASFEAEEALYDIKCIWNSTEGEFSRKLCTTNRLVIYYLLILAIYIIHVCFLIDEKLFEGLCKIINSITGESEK